MSHDDDPRATTRAAEADAHDELPAVAALLKRSLSSASPEAGELAAEQTDTDALLASVQRKLRERSDGKFYGDGWSTSRASARYALVATVMLLLLAVIYVALGPTGLGPT